MLIQLSFFSERTQKSFRKVKARVTDVTVDFWDSGIFTAVI
jgi:hypothetical protein